MLDTSRIAFVGITDKSHNALLREIWEAVKAYNAMTLLPKGVVSTKSFADALDRVTFAVGTYLTSKPPQPRAKNKTRWNALRDLAEKIGAEAARLGIRQLHGPSDYRKVEGRDADTQYWLERMDPQHRVGRILSDKYWWWLRNEPAIKAKTSFWEFMGTISSPSAAQQQVQYYQFLDQTELAKSRVYFKDQVLCDSFFDAEVHTEDMETHFTGKGWGIFVCSPDRKLYVHSHHAGVHHHSSFLGGGAVLAAGEVVVNQGTVLVVTAKSGHYKPTPENILNFVQVFRQIPGHAVVQVDMVKPRFYWCWQFRNMGEKAPALKRGEVIGAVPKFAHSDKFLKSLTKIPV